ncbi:MAG: tripartite tricarboxylate transporter TctB family protein, partial [Rhodospirillaceae bacterium]
LAFIPKRLILLGLTLGYILVIPYAGFTLTTFAFLTAGMLTLSNGKKAGFILFLSALLSIGGYLLFIAAFKTRFPMGPIESALKGIL